MGDLASSRKTSQTNTTVNRQVGQQGQTNSAFTGDINLDLSRQYDGSYISRGMKSIPSSALDVINLPAGGAVPPGISDAGQTVNIDLSTGSDKVALAAIEKVAQSSNQALLDTLVGTSQIVNRTIDFADNTQSKFADAIQPSLSTDPGKQSLLSQDKLLIAVGLLVIVYFINRKHS